MTAEIGIITRSGVALATDSVATFSIDSGINKYITVEKLFPLSKYFPVGIMVYDSSDFTDIPWETVIKVYTSYLGNKSFDTLQEYAEDLLKFLAQDKRINNSSYEKRLVRKVLEHCLMENKIELKSRHKRASSEEIEKKFEYYSHEKFTDGFDNSFIKLFLDKHSDELTEYMNEIVNINIDKKLQEKLMLLCAYVISKSNYLIEEQPSSGIIIAGYGEKEIFPVLTEYKIVGVINETLINRLENKIKIIQSSNNPYNVSSSIIPFAQKDVVETYTWGIDTELKNILSNQINEIFDNFFEAIQSESESNTEFISKLSSKDKEEINKIGLKLKKRMVTEFNNKQEKKYLTPFRTMIDILGKDEMAALAESLVNLTSTRRRFTTDEETVGGPVAVAIITKGEGFTWIKKKQFFKPELNTNRINVDLPTS